MSKNIVILNGSPDEGGNSQLLADALAEGAREAGATAERVDICKLNIAPYTGPGQKPEDDDTATVMTKVVAADAVVLAFPFYWMQMSAQLKAFMDRLPFGSNEVLSGKRAGYLVRAASPAEKIDECISPYLKMCFGESLKWVEVGHVYAGGAFAPGMVATMPYMDQARDLGRKLAE